MKKILIALGIAGAVGVVLVVVAVVKLARVFHEAEGRAFFSSVGAETRIDEFAHASGKSNYIAEADKQLAMLQRNLDQFRQTASAADIARFEQMQATAYQTTDKNIKGGLNPLAYLDSVETASAERTNTATSLSTNK